MNSFFLWSIAIRIVIGSSHLSSNLCGVTPYDQSDTLRDNSAVKVFILAGQSNAVGYNNLREYTGNVDTLRKELFELHNVIFWPGSNARKEMENKWVKLQIGVSNIAEEEPFLNNCFGPEIGLGLALSKIMPKEEIAIIKYAERATGIARSIDYYDYIPALKGFDDNGRNWYPPSESINAGLLFSNLMENIRNALSVLKLERQKFEICGFIWMQGEHEAGISKRMAEDYGTLLVLFRDAVRKELNKKELPFAICEINSHTWAYGDIARKKQKEACDEDINSVLINTTDLPRGGIGGEAHFTADGMLILGKRIARDIFELLDEKTKTTQ